MITISANTYAYFDVDDTLIFWDATPEQKESHGVMFTCPASQELNDVGELVDCPGWKELLVPHRKHIEQLKKHRSRYTKVVVWSAAGADWAEAVVKTLGLEKYVDICIGKPTWCYDDLQPHEFIPKVKWLKDE